MSSFRLLSQQVFLVGFGVFELLFFSPCAEFFVIIDSSPPSLENRCVTIYEKNETKMKERKVSTIQRSTRSATRSPTRSLTRSLTRTRTRCPTRGFRIPRSNMTPLRPVVFCGVLWCSQSHVNFSRCLQNIAEGFTLEASGF